MNLNNDIIPYNKESLFNILNTIELRHCKKKKNGVKYLDLVTAFDIETTSTYYNDEKCAFMYVWQFGIEGYTIYGRKWEEFDELLRTLSEYYELDSNTQIVCYIHNASYEFQFMRKYISITKVFALNTRKVAYFETEYGITFKCSLVLSGYSLEKLADELRTYTVNKAVGDLDYTQVRTSKTPLTPAELYYCKMDVIVVMCYIAEKIENGEPLNVIPLTKTSYVRRRLRKACYAKGNYTYYSKLMNRLTLTPEEYKMCRNAFQGGFTHASFNYIKENIYNVSSIDFTSSYPYHMVAYKYPMSKGKRVIINSVDDFKRYINKYCCIFEISFFGIKSKMIGDDIISESHCFEKINTSVFNGRVHAADKLSMTITNIDFKAIQLFYTWDSMSVGVMYVYMKDYLPKPIIRETFEMYKIKTEYKDVSGKEMEYQSAKADINSEYGCMVTDIMKPEQIYDYEKEEWEQPQPKDINDAIELYNNSKNRFLFYPWGVFVTAYARYSLFTGIYEFSKNSDDYIYSDTDSIKCLNITNHMEYINNYNNGCSMRLDAVLNHYHLPKEYKTPKTVKGVVKMLGVWDDESHNDKHIVYKRFKTLGAKRYMYITEYDKLNMTVSGLNKKITVPYLLNKFNSADDIFSFFDDEMYIPDGKTGKLTHTYIDDEFHGLITDYKGNTSEVISKSSIHLSESDYSLSFSDKLARWLLDIREVTQ